MKSRLLHTIWAPLTATLLNLVLAYACYQIARVAYLLDNWQYLKNAVTWEAWQGGLVFDTAAIMLTNGLYIVLMLLPVLPKERRWWHVACRWLFVVVNSTALVMNLADAAYFPYTMRRTTTTVFSEFSNEGNLGGIVATELIAHWYMVVLAVGVIWAMWRLYTTPAIDRRKTGAMRYAMATTLSLLVMLPLVVAGVRGGFATAVRPITVSNANQYVSRPTDAALVLNTPFAMYRTIGKDVFTVPDYYADTSAMERVYSPLHVPTDTLPMEKRNVVVLIVESFGREYIGALNTTLENSKYEGYTPFVDSLVQNSVTFTHTYCNGRKSIDGMPSILSSIPMFVEPFFLTPAAMNRLSGLAGVLGAEGYQTAFFHGAQRGSMGFMAFARSTGFDAYYGREDFEADKRFGGSGEFDGMWAVWDEPFLQYYAAKMSEMKEPFMTAVFTASSHHPYHIPEKYKDVFKDDGVLPIHKCIRYTDYALRRFFEKASREKWFSNTIFVLTSDHTNQSCHAEYLTDIGGFSSPIIIYAPGDERLTPRMEDKTAQQIDIMPTVLGLLHYGKPYVAFGKDVLQKDKEETWAVNYLNGIYQYVKNDHVLQFDGARTTAVYALSDSLMQHNMVGKVDSQMQMEQELKAIIQQYMYRVTNDELVAH